ncbi:hypothetical protein MXB_2717 [Myxobolus squamalis]|nr:hypothetical protein MXB_2717 [Myxobolus squamalis]
MDRQENKIPLEYQNFVNYNQSNWGQNPYTNPVYLNGFDTNMQTQNNPLCQVICTQSTAGIANFDYYRYGGLLQSNPPNQPTTNNFIIDPTKCIYNTSCYVPDESYQHTAQAAHLQQRSGPMRAWLNNHLNDPYPSSHEKQKLAEDCNKSYIQVCTWFANARRSLRRQGAIGPRIRRNKSITDFSETNSINSAQINTANGITHNESNDTSNSQCHSSRVATTSAAHSIFRKK